MVSRDSKRDRRDQNSDGYRVGDVAADVGPEHFFNQQFGVEGGVEPRRGGECRRGELPRPSPSPLAG